MTALKFGKDCNGFNAFAPRPSTNMWSANLNSGGLTSITVPSDFDEYNFCLAIQPGTSIWVDFTGDDAAYPLSDTLSSTTSELNPASRTVLAGSTISLITSDTNAEVGVVLYGTN